jgi:chromosome segregation ATPase
MSGTSVACYSSAFCPTIRRRNMLVKKGIEATIKVAQPFVPLFNPTGPTIQKRHNERYTLDKPTSKFLFAHKPLPIDFFYNQSSMKKVNELTNAVELLTKKLADLTTENASYQEQIQQHNQNFETLQTQLKEQKEIEQLRHEQQMEAYHKLVEHLQSQSQENNKEIESLNNNVQQLSDEVKEKDKVIDALKNNNDTLKNDVQLLSEKIASLENDLKQHSQFILQQENENEAIYTRLDEQKPLNEEQQKKEPKNVENTFRAGWEQAKEQKEGNKTNSENWKRKLGQHLHDKKEKAKKYVVRGVATGVAGAVLSDIKKKKEQGEDLNPLEKAIDDLNANKQKLKEIKQQGDNELQKLGGEAVQVFNRFKEKVEAVRKKAMFKDKDNNQRVSTGPNRP